PPAPETPDVNESEGTAYVINTNTDKFHREDCRYATSIKEENRAEFLGDRADLIADGYTPCGTCKP
ncbi:MAG: MBL fold metallo-hydrolase, partial [Clostridia bacterium]|nr:MBL fold metallo-hydrolase [Clostridia bacterium]